MGLCCTEPGWITGGTAGRPDEAGEGGPISMVSMDSGDSTAADSVAGRAPGIAEADGMLMPVSSMSRSRYVIGHHPIRSERDNVVAAKKVSPSRPLHSSHSAKRADEPTR